MLVTAFAVLSIAPAAYGQGTLTVVKSPAAGGTVTAVADDEFETPLIACGSRCSAPFATQEVCAGPPYRPVCHDEVVGARLQATAAAGWTVRDFSGCTAVANACSVSGGQNRIVNYRMKHNMMIVDYAVDKAILISGVGWRQQKVKITRGG